METYTQSEIMTWDNCPQKHHFQYRELLELKNARPSWALLYGSAVHSALDEWRQGKLASAAIEKLQLKIPDNVILGSEEEIERDYWNAVLQATIARYVVKYADDSKIMKLVSNEEILKTEFMGVWLEGKIDAVYSQKKKLILMDTKTAGRFDAGTYDAWQFKFQFMFYLWLLHRCKGVMPNEMMIDLVMKPALRRKQDESIEALISRIKASMVQEPDKYFKRIPLTNLKGSMEYFEKNILLPKIGRILAVDACTDLTNPEEAAMLNILTRNMNTDNCVKFGQPCSFLPLCVHGQAERFRYTERAVKHVELGEATE
jgi:hypothetical protein